MGSVKSTVKILAIFIIALWAQFPLMAEQPEQPGGEMINPCGGTTATSSLTEPSEPCEGTTPNCLLLPTVKITPPPTGVLCEGDPPPPARLEVVTNDWKGLPSTETFPATSQTQPDANGQITVTYSGSWVATKDTCPTIVLIYQYKYQQPCLYRIFC